MGRKKKKVDKPWCWYCGREFDDEKILIQHQKAKHFKCHICNKKLFTGPGLAIHCMQVHKETIDRIPGAIHGRDSIDVEVYGMEGIPQEYEGPSEPKAKKPSMSVPTTSTPMMPTMPGFPMPAMPGFPAQMTAMSMPYGTGQFFGARNQFPQLTNPQMMKQAFPQGMPRFAAIPGFPGGIPNAANIPMPGSIPTSTIPQMSTSQFSAYPRQTMPQMSSASFVPYPQSSSPSMLAGANSHTSAASMYNAPSTSAQPVKSLGSKTHIVVPDENISLEESMADRLEKLSQVRYH